jgi:hypothetical protein
MSQTLKFGNGTWATKKGSILAYSDTNENYKPLPFNYTGAGKGTRVNKEGLIEVVENDRPRIDYLDSEDGVFLLEKAATNLFPYSEDFENSDWTKNAGTTITNNYAISPDGSLNASRYLGTGTSGFGDKFTLSATSYTISFYIKSNTSENQYCRLIGDSSNVSENLLITTEWTRLSYTFTGSGLSNKTNGIFRDSNDNDIDILIYGAQLESGNLSSYIPTQGSIQTRVQETASGSGNSEVFNDSEGVLFADISALANDGTYRFLSVSAGAYANSIRIGYFTTPNVIEFRVVAGGIPQTQPTHTLSDTTIPTKVAGKYKQNDFALWVNGFKVDADTNGNTPSGLSELAFDDGNNSSNSPFYGKTKEIGYYDTVLTDLELETLTSYRSWLSMVKELNLNVIYNG